MQGILVYLKNPVYYSHNEKCKGNNFLSFLFLYFFTAIPLSGVVLLICLVSDIKLNPVNLSLPMKFLIGVVIAPIYEEIIFRSLLKINKNSISLFLVTIISFILFYALRSEFKYVIFLSSLLIIFILILKIFSIDELRNFVSRNFYYIFFSSAIIFGALHAINFSGENWVLILFSVILGAPQIALGTILGYIRMKYGLLFCILFYMTLNLSILFS